MNEDSEDGIISEDEIILLKPPFKRKKKIIKQCKCRQCKYLEHTNPPQHFNQQFHGYCCLWCKLSNGQNHGKQCQRRRYNRRRNPSYRKKSVIHNHSKIKNLCHFEYIDHNL